MLQHRGVSYQHLGLVCAPYTGLRRARLENLLCILVIYWFFFSNPGLYRLFSPLCETVLAAGALVEGGGGAALPGPVLTRAGGAGEMPGAQHSALLRQCHPGSV